MALTTQPPPASFAYMLSGNNPPLVHGAEKASQTYVIGAFLQDDDAGRITPSATPIDASAVTKRTFGLALANASGVTGQDVLFLWINGETVIEITLSNLSTGSHTLAQGDQWQVFAITKGTTNWYLDANAQSDTGGGIVIGFKDAIGTVDARVYMLVSPAARGGANTSEVPF